MQVIQNEDEVIVIDNDGNKFLKINPGQQTYEFGDLDGSSNGCKVVIKDRSGTQNVKISGTSLVIPIISEAGKADFIFEKGSVLLNETTGKFQGFNGVSWVNF